MKKHILKTLGSRALAAAIGAAMMIQANAPVIASAALSHQRLKHRANPQQLRLHLSLAQAYLHFPVSVRQQSAH